MNKVLTLVIISAALAAAGLYWFNLQTHAPDESINKSQVSASPSPFVQEEEKTSDQVLFDLKSSIKGVIDDSVQEDIQQAVQSEIKKADSE